jgi:glycosyltransferase involved in cell wall biosynthesis
MTSIGLIISTYEWPEALVLVLSSVAGQSHRPTEVIVADDGSGAATAAVVKKWSERAPFPLVHAWQEDRGFRLSRARNLAIRQSTADYLIILDGDEVLHRHFVRDHLRALRPGQVLRGSRAVLSAQRSAEALATGRVPRWGEKGVSKRAAALRLPLLSLLLRNWRARGTEGFYLACWRDDAIRVNGFEERFEGWGGEDAEFVMRLRHAGVEKKRLRFSAVMYHLDHPKASREQTARTHALYEQTVATRRVSAIQGLAELVATA